MAALAAYAMAIGASLGAVTAFACTQGEEDCPALLEMRCRVLAYPQLTEEDLRAAPEFRGHIRYFDCGSTKHSMPKSNSRSASLASVLQGIASLK